MKLQFSIKALAVVALAWIDDGGMRMRLQSFIKAFAVVGLASINDGGIDAEIWGQLMHTSGANKSNKSRIAYTFSIIDGDAKCPDDSYMKPVRNNFESL